MSLLTKLPLEFYDHGAFAGFAAGSDFSLGNGKSQIWLSQLAYETDEPDKIATILQFWGLRLAQPGIFFAEIRTALPIASTHGFVAAGRGATFVSFAGTDPVVLANWISDFDARIDKDTQIADGYETAANAVAEQVRQAISDPALSGNKIYVTGHSLGGALAVVTALHLQSSGTNVEAVYTFGMPRAGSPAFATGYNSALGSRSYRLVDADDLVPTVAPSDLDFHHVGRILRCQRGGRFDPNKLAADTTSDEPNFVAGVSKELRDFLQGPLSGMSAPLAQLKLALTAAAGGGPAGVRTDVAGLVIELLPPRLRDHMTDRYIAAF